MRPIWAGFDPAVQMPHVAPWGRVSRELLPVHAFFSRGDVRFTRSTSQTRRDPTRAFVDLYMWTLCALCRMYHVGIFAVWRFVPSRLGIRSDRLPYFFTITTPSIDRSTRALATARPWIPVRRRPAALAWTLVLLGGVRGHARQCARARAASELSAARGLAALRATAHGTRIMASRGSDDLADLALRVVCNLAAWPNPGRPSRKRFLSNLFTNSLDSAACARASRH